MRRCILTIIAFALLLIVAAPLRAADLLVSDLLVSYTTQTDSTATGQVSFNLRLTSDESGTPGFDLFSSQILIRQLLSDDSKASFALNESLSETDGPARDGYWIDAALGGNQNASTVGDEFRYSDFLPFGNVVVPAVNSVVARFAIDFEIDDAEQFGTYEIAPGNSAFNLFSRNLVNITSNDLQTRTFDLLPPIPEPTTGLLAMSSAAVLVTRRRRSVAS